LSPVDERAEGRIEDGDGDEGVEKKSGMNCKPIRRWARVVRCAVSIGDAVEWFSWVEGLREWKVEGCPEREGPRVERGEKGNGGGGEEGGGCNEYR
jgi:hypothetical protein